ncbi:MAG: AmmeMemoRadiSam system protein B [Candidatus Omnitrophica bacterium]|jgi:AmmeMemoRadiSam system protein B/AmmeMemoRadiSam system protein A|nr:AmmeMemoRadiSam system protein B [Candidatus Omnitrophota bacterium]
MVFFFSCYSEDFESADLAGSWYPKDPEVLKSQISNYIDKASLPSIDGEIIAIISPHAGLAYSGEVAAYGFKAVAGKPITTVILVGFSHRQDYDGIAVFEKEGFKTPLGVIYNDKELAQKVISTDKKFVTNNLVFKGENSLELILPFIQVVLGEPKVLLLSIGRQSFDNCLLLGNTIADILKEKENFLIIASTDMSHYLPNTLTKETDAETVTMIENMNPQELYQQCYGQNRMCGLGAVVSVMIAAEKLGAKESLILKQATSTRNTDSNEKSVGYLSAAFLKTGDDKLKGENDMDKLLDDKQKKKLLKIARSTIEHYLEKGEVLNVDVDDPTLKKVFGVFVTLNKDGHLRGCIGNIIGHKPLYLGVRDMAIASAVEDPRFPPLNKSELPKINIEISVLSPLEKITDPDKIILGTHGVLVKKGFRSGVYLPQVATETGWSKEEFMNSLCAQKAGFESEAWKKGSCEIYIFTAEVFGE